MNLLLDPRAGSGDLAGPLRQLGVPTEVIQMEYGDAALDGCGPDDIPVPIGVEVKKLGDLLQCFTDNRLVGHQLLGLTQRYQIVYLLVEGVVTAGADRTLLVKTGKEWKELAHGRRWTYHEVAERLMGLEDHWGVRIAQTADRRGTASWLAALYARWSKPWSAHTSHRGMFQQRFRGDGNPFQDFATTRKMQVAKALVDGVGWEKARALSQHFPSVREMIGASRAELVGVPGVGPKLAQRFILAVDERSTE